MKIFALQDIPASLMLQVGGKARGLCRLSHCGLRVPPGFVLVDVGSDDDVRYATAWWAQSGLGTVAVRSSASAEDGSDYSAAGQYHTALNVYGEVAVANAIRDCLASLSSGTAEQYSTYFSAAGSHGMCVVIQQMIEADAAGVCFTKDPSGGGMRIEAVEGLGENLVSGCMDTHIYHADEALQGDDLITTETT